MRQNGASTFGNILIIKHLTKTRQTSLTKKSINQPFLYVEEEVHYIAVLDGIILTFS